MEAKMSEARAAKDAGKSPSPAATPAAAPTILTSALKSEAPILDRIAALEKSMQGEEGAGGAMPRVKALEQDLLGEVSKGPLPARVSALEDAMGVSSRRFAHPRALFNFLDTNGDGFLDMEELRVGLDDIGHPADDVEALLFTLDTNQDGKVSWEEFERGCSGA